jgi:hypothetical protein
MTAAVESARLWSNGLDRHYRPSETENADD